jgi:hypothetical protein
VVVALVVVVVGVATGVVFVVGSAEDVLVALVEGVRDR